MKKVITTLIVALVLLQIVSAMDWRNWNPISQHPASETEAEFGENFDWYDVTDWEKDVCGEVTDLDEYGRDSGIMSGVVGPWRSSVTIQALKTTMEDEGVNKTLYEVAWYLQPMSYDEGKHWEYAVAFYNEKNQGAPYWIYDGEISDKEGDSGYYAELIEGIDHYDYAVIAYEGGEFMAPFVEKKIYG